MLDIAVTSTGDIDLSTGDIRKADTTDFHKKNVLLAKKGDFKHAPTVGVQVRSFLNSNKTERFLRAVRRNFLQIGINVVSLSYNKTTGVLTETGEYVED